MASVTAAAGCHCGRVKLSLTAGRLGVHVNTVRQRLDVLREVLGGWDDPVKALELHLALRLGAMLG